MTRRAGGWFVWAKSTGSQPTLREVAAELAGDYQPRHLADGVGRQHQPRTGRHSPEYVAMHEATGRMQPLGQAMRVRPEWEYERGL